MKIDAHQHYWNFNVEDYGWMEDKMAAIRRDFSPEDLKIELTRMDFDGSIAVQARQKPEETNWLLQLAAQYPHIKGVVGWIDLRSPEVEQLLSDFASRPKAVGVRHVIHDEPEEDFMLQKDFIRGIRALENTGLVYDLLLFPKHLKNASKLLGQCSANQTFVLDHISKPDILNGVIEPWKEDLGSLAKFPNVYCKLSGMVTEADWNNWKPEDFHPYLDAVIELFGIDRVLIGSDWPVCLVSANYKTVMSIVMDYIKKYPEDIQNKILGGNAVKAYKLIK